jgi:hypothetical protein
MPLFRITEGWTGMLGPFTLKIDGVPFNLNTYTPTIVIRKPSGALVAAGGQVSVLNQGTNPGQVTYDPAPTDFAWESGRYTNAQIFTVRWKVTDSNNKVVYFPNGEPDEIEVYRG